MDNQIIIILSYNMQYQKNISVAISKGKDEYQRQLAQKIRVSARSKSYWSVLKRFYNGKKVSVVSLLLTYNKLESDFEATIPPTMF